MGDHGIQVGGQIDDVDGSEGTFLGANTTTDTSNVLQVLVLCV